MMKGDRQTRRMLERMGVNFEPIPDVVEVIIKTSNKDRDSKTLLTNLSR